MMKENTENGMLEDIEISLEEFEELNECHNFSDEYKNKKKEALKNYRKYSKFSTIYIIFSFLL